MKTYNTPAFALGTFSSGAGTAFSGLVLNDTVLDIAALAPLTQVLGLTLLGSESVLQLLEHWEHNITSIEQLVAALQSDTAEAIALREQFVPVENLKVFPPVNLPRQIFMSGANYFKHVVDLIVDQGPGKNPDTEGMNPEELRRHAENLMTERQKNGDPYFFCKPVSAISSANDPIVLLDIAESPDWELELAVIIGKPAFQINRNQAMEYVAGYSISNDISNRGQIYRTDDMKALGTDWISSKSSPGYLPFGPYLVPTCCIPDPDNLTITLKLNGDIMQNENTADMIFNIPRLIEYISSRVQLLPGDIICTGSPSGNGTHYQRFLQPGDLVESSISGLGIQRNPVQSESD